MTTELNNKQLDLFDKTNTTQMFLPLPIISVTVQNSSL